MRRVLIAKTLQRAAFAPFGDVIETEKTPHFQINAGWAERYHDLATLDLTQQQGRPALSIFRAEPRPMPVMLATMERHRLGSQAFFSLSAQPFLLVVAPAGPVPAGPEDLVAFVTNGKQGINYRPGVWHHPLLVIERSSDFLVVDRIGPTADCEELDIAAWNVSLSG
ncbi:MAG: ureidoglycolate lyase [Gammaproteobacteria bacterium]|nr:ureidoglycolate lyase [Gammaproteobacteria bacterium]